MKPKKKILFRSGDSVNTVSAAESAYQESGPPLGTSGYSTTATTDSSSSASVEMDGNYVVAPEGGYVTTAAAAEEAYQAPRW